MDYFKILKEIIITINKYCIVHVHTYLQTPSRKPPQNPPLKYSISLHLFTYSHGLPK